MPAYKAYILPNDMGNNDRMTAEAITNMPPGNPISIDLYPPRAVFHNRKEPDN